MTYKEALRDDIRFNMSWIERLLNRLREAEWGFLLDIACVEQGVKFEDPGIFDSGNLVIECGGRWLCRGTQHRCGHSPGDFVAIVCPVAFYRFDLCDPPACTLLHELIHACSNLSAEQEHTDVIASVLEACNQPPKINMRDICPRAFGDRYGYDY